MKRIAIITGILTVLMLTTTAQRHERSGRARNHHECESKTIRKIDKRLSNTDKTHRRTAVHKQKDNHRTRALKTNRHDKEKKRNNHAAVNQYRSHKDYRINKNANRKVRGYYSSHYKRNDRRQSRDGNINHHHHKRWQKKYRCKYPARPRMRTYWVQPGICSTSTTFLISGHRMSHRISQRSPVGRQSIISTKLKTFTE